MRDCVTATRQIQFEIELAGFPPAIAQQFEVADAQTANAGPADRGDGARKLQRLFHVGMGFQQKKRGAQAHVTTTQGIIVVESRRRFAPSPPCDV